MSEEVKAKVVEEENPSAAEKETKALKKMGFDTGVEEIAKVDLRTPKEEKDATEEQSTDEVPVRDGSETSEEVRKEDETQPEEPAGESQEEEKKEEAIIEEVQEPAVEENKETAETQDSVQEPLPQQENTEPKVNIPENVYELVEFMNETGGTIEDYVGLNKDYSKYDNDQIIKEFYNKTKPHLESSEISFLMEDNFSYDQEIDDPKDIKRKQLAYKEEVALAKKYLEDQKAKYYKEVKLTDTLSKEQQKAVDFFNRYNTEQHEIAQQQEKATNQFKLKTNEVFNQEFKGFDFKVDDKKFRYKIKDIDNVKDTQMNIMNVVGSYLSKDNTLEDGYGYHKALFAAKNADSIANHFYQLGKTEAIKEISAESKNINMDPRQTSSGTVEAGGIKVRAISGDDSNKLRIKLKK